MSGQAAGSTSESNSQSNFNQRVWKPQGKALQQLYEQAFNLYNNQLAPMLGQMQGAIGNQQSVFNQSMPAFQQQLGGGVYQNMGLQNSLMNSLNQSLNNPTKTSEINSMIMGGSGNNYADAMKNQYMKDAQQASDMMNANLDARVAGGGLSGSSRHGVAQALGMRDINNNLQRNLAETGFNTFDKDLERKLSIAREADQGTLARQNMLATMLGQQNQSQQQGLNYGQAMQGLNMGQFSPYSVPWSSANSLANIIGNPSILGQGSSSSNSKSLAQSGGGGI